MVSEKPVVPRYITVWVLILVLVEDGLGGGEKIYVPMATQSLNPCFSGGWSRSIMEG